MALDYSSPEATKGLKAFGAKTASTGIQATGAATRDRAQAPTAKAASPNFFSNIVNSTVSAVTGIGGMVSDYVTKEVPRQFTNVASGVVDAVTSNSRMDVINKASESNGRAQEDLVKQLRAKTINRKDFDTQLAGLVNEQKITNSELEVIDKATNRDAANKFVVDAFVVGLTPFAFGKLTSVSTKGAASAVSEAFAARYSTVAAKTANASKVVEQMAAKIPSLKGPLGGDYRAGTSIGNVIAGVIKKPLLLDSTVKSTDDTLKAAINGEFGTALIGAALLTSGIFKGGPIGLAISGAKKGGEKFATMAFGKAGFYDELAKVGKMKDNPIGWLGKLKESDPVAYARNIKTAKLIQAFNLSHYDGDAKSAAQNIIEWQSARGRPLSDMTSQDLFDDLNEWHDNYSAIINEAKSGLLKLDGEVIKLDKLNRIGVGAFDTKAKFHLIEQLNTAANADERMQMIQEMIDEGVQWSQNPNVRSAVMMFAKGDDYAKQMHKVLKTASQGLEMSPAGMKALTKGYFPILLGENAKLYSPELLDEFAKTSNIETLTNKLGGAFDNVPLDRSQPPDAIVGKIGFLLSKAGLSTQDQSQVAFRAISKNFAAGLTRSGVVIKKAPGSTDKGVDIVMKKLSAVVDEKKQVFDIRQLYTKDIVHALDVSTADAIKIRGAIVDAYVKLPLEIRGLGNKLQDINMAFNPAARAYSRAQSGGRYAFNPFFRSQEISETEIFSQLYSGGKRLQLPGVNSITNLFRRDRDEMETTVRALDKLGVFTDGGGRRMAESGADLLLGNKITAQISPSQKISMAGLVGRLAEKRGVDVETLLKDSPEEIGAMMRTIIQYPKKSVLNSSFATTLNVAIFPMRYSLKVASMTASILSQQAPIVQIAMINSLMDFGDWLKSDEGVGWQSTHSEAIGIFKYFTPINNLETIYKALTGNVHSVAELGQLGGLPFGFIGTMLDSQGIIRMGTPYVNPKDGSVMPDYIPETTKARAKQALDDLLTSVFSYPGRTLGLPGKGQTVRNFTNNLTGVDSSEYTVVPRTDLTPVQQNQQRVLQGINTDGTSNPYQTWSLPPNLPKVLARPAYTPAGVRPVKPVTLSAAKPKKIARPMPTL